MKNAVSYYPNTLPLSFLVYEVDEGSEYSVLSSSDSIFALPYLKIGDVSWLKVKSDGSSKTGDYSSLSLSVKLDTPISEGSYLEI